MPGGLLYRMILWDLARVFCVSLVGITGILLMAGLIAEASQQGLAPSQILAAIPLLVPSTLPYTIPATTLFACCVCYGRLSADGEVLAVKAAGVHLARVVAPGVALGLAMSAATMALYFHIIPATHSALRAMILRDAQELVYSLLRRHGMIAHPQLPYAMFVKGVEGKKLINPVVKRKNARGQIDLVAHAREAELAIDLDKAILVVSMRSGVAITEDNARVSFESRTFDVPLPSNLFNSNRFSARDMTWGELRHQRGELLEKRQEVKERINGVVERIRQGGGPRELVYHLQLFQDRSKQLRDYLRQIDVELMMRPALSLGCLCFILVGCPVGIWFSRGDYLSAFITCFLPVVTVYYPLMLAGTNLARGGVFNIATLVFAADVAVGMGGLVLFRRLLAR